MNDAVKYRPEIDGLRALAVVPVVLFHSGIPGFSGGYVGVDIFFVISGYLITRIIHGELEEGRFSIVKFYERRARRVLPALTVMLVAATGVAALVMSAPDMVAYAGALTATLLFASNFWFWKQAGGYFEPDVETHPLLHTWSLAVEEQFYIVFPLLLMACARWMPARMRVAVAVGSAISLALAIWQVEASPNTAFFLAPTRAWELGLGALLALGAIPHIPGRVVREAMGWMAIALILAPIFLYSAATPFPGLAAIPPCLGAALIIHLGDSSAGRTLAWRPFVRVGLISYSLYLWHWPVAVLARGVLAQSHLPLGWGIGVVTLSVALGWLSWRYVEGPFRSPARVSQKRIFQLSGLAGASLAALAGALWLLDGMPQRFSPAERKLIEARYDTNPRRDICLGKLPPETLCPLGARQAEPTFLLWGDSHGDALQPAIEIAAEKAGIGGVMFGRMGCAPLLGIVHRLTPCNRIEGALIDYLRRNPRIETVVLSARWSLYRSAAPYGEERNRIEPLRPTDSRYAGLASAPAFDHVLRDTVATLTGMGKRVVLIGDNPEIGWDVPSKLFAAYRFGAQLPPVPSPKAVALRQLGADLLFHRLAAGDTRVTYVPLFAHFCAATCRIISADGTPLYFDDDHLSNAGARDVAPVLEPVFTRIARPRH